MKFQLRHKTLEPALKIVISIWVIYHLAAIVILPNGSSFLGRTFNSYLLPYANQIGANNPWNFFSPDPAHTMYFEYNIDFENENRQALKEPIQGFIPPEKTAIVMNTAGRRMLYAMRFLLVNPGRVEELVAPWLCVTNEGASHVSIAYKLLRLPTLDRAVMSEMTSIDDLKTESDMRNLSFDCKKGMIQE